MTVQKAWVMAPVLWRMMNCPSAEKYVSRVVGSWVMQPPRLPPPRPQNPLKRFLSGLLYSSEETSQPTGGAFPKEGVGAGGQELEQISCPCLPALREPRGGAHCQPPRSLPWPQTMGEPLKSKGRKQDSLRQLQGQLTNLSAFRPAPLGSASPAS